MSGFAHPEYLVTTEWLAAHLDEPNVIVLDCTMHLIPDPKINYQMKPGLEGFKQNRDGRTPKISSKILLEPCTAALLPRCWTVAWVSRSNRHWRRASAPRTS